MKEKLIAFFKKPLNIIAVVVTFLGILGMILTSAIPTGSYYGKAVEDDVEMNFKFVFKNDKFSLWVKLSDEELEDYKDGLTAEEIAEEIKGNWVIEGNETKCEIKNGKVYINNREVTYVTSINGLKLVLDDGFLDFDKSITCTNKLAVAFFIVSCVFLGAGVAWIVYAVFFDKKKKVAKTTEAKVAEPVKEEPAKVETKEPAKKAEPKATAKKTTTKAAATKTATKKTPAAKKTTAKK